MIRNPWKHRCWLLASPRSGSTYLQYLLNTNAGVPVQPHPTDPQWARLSFGEHLNHPFCETWQEYLNLDPIVSRVHCHHFGHFFLRRLEFRKQFPEMRFILIERKDIAAQAVSLALSNATGIAHCPEITDLKSYRSLAVEISTEQLLECYHDIQEYQKFWRNWLHSEPHLSVTYESLIEFPQETIAQALDFLNVNYSKINVEVPLNKLEHPQSSELKQRLKIAWSQESANTSATSVLMTMNT